MNKFNAKAKDLNFLGRLGENQFTVIRFPEAAAVFAQIPDAQVTILHQRPGDPAAYPVNPAYVRIEGGAVEWQIQSGDLATRGDGFAQLVFTQNNVVAKTLIYHTRIGNALDGAGDPPEPWESWVQTVIDAGNHAPQIINGTWWTWSTEAEEYIDTEYPARGQQGDPGDPGAPGKDGDDYVITQADYQAIAEEVAQDAGFQQTKDAVEGMAYGTKDGSPVSSDSPYYQNNAYYYMLLCLALSGKYPKVENGYWYVWDAQNEQWTSTGVKATGADGVSPTVSITSITGGTRVTITDGTGDHTFDVMNGTNGEDGDDGVSPTITITDITGGHRVTITDATGDHTFDVMDGTGSVTDVQVNGVSVLSQGVANVPIAKDNTFGVVKTSSGWLGTATNNDGLLYVVGASDSQIKAGTDSYRAVMAGQQHRATFYGLAKAAGDSTQSSSSNAVGTYTEDALSKISSMLNAPVSVSGTTPLITALPGVRYVCGEVATLDITLPASGCIDVTFESGSTATVLTITPPTGQTVSWANGFDPTSLDANTTYELNICDLRGVAGSWT